MVVRLSRRAGDEPRERASPNKKRQQGDRSGVSEPAQTAVCLAAGGYHQTPPQGVCHFSSPSAGKRAEKTPAQVRGRARIIRGSRRQPARQRAKPLGGKTLGMGAGGGRGKPLGEGQASAGAVVAARPSSFGSPTPGVPPLQQSGLRHATRSGSIGAEIAPSRTKPEGSPISS